LRVAEKAFATKKIENFISIFQLWKFNLFFQPGAVLLKISGWFLEGIKKY